MNCYVISVTKPVSFQPDLKSCKTMKIKIFKIKNYLAVFLLIYSHYQLSHLAIHQHLWGSFLSTVRAYYHSLGDMFWKRGLLPSICVKGLQVLLLFVLSHLFHGLLGKTGFSDPFILASPYNFLCWNSLCSLRCIQQGSLILGYLGEQKTEWFLWVCGGIATRLLAQLSIPRIAKMSQISIRTDVSFS